MKPILTEPAAAAVIVIDEAGGASLSEVATASGRALSTMQRGVEGLIAGGVLRRTTPRGPLVFRPDAPKRALREVAGWTLGRTRTRSLTNAAARLRLERGERADALPPTVRSRVVKDHLPQAIGQIVDAYDPYRVILFGSQARGDARPDSDVDLLVEFDDKVDRRALQVQIGRLLRDQPFAKDVLVASTSDLPNAARGTAIAEAAHDGLVVYER